MKGQGKMQIAYKVTDEDFEEVMGAEQLKHFAKAQILNNYNSIDETDVQQRLSYYTGEELLNLIVLLNKVFEDKYNTELFIAEAIGLLNFRDFQVKIIELN